MDLKYVVDISKLRNIEDLLGMIRYSRDSQIEEFTDERILFRHYGSKEFLTDSGGVLARWESFGFKVKLLEYPEDKNWQTIPI